jgi:threonine/homoserine/homoserine lactone efflux protein
LNLKPKNNPNPGHIKNTSARSLFKSSFIVTALNPKRIAFFVAFLPQFMDSLKPAFLRLTSLGAIFLLLATINATLYALFAGQLNEHVRNQKARKWFDRCRGSAFIGAGILTAGMNRTTWLTDQFNAQAAFINGCGKR